MRKATIHGYCDRLSVAPGERIEFKVSCEEAGTYRADVVRLVHGDTNPAGPGFKEEVVESDANGDYDGRLQPTDAGSCIVVEDGGALALDGAFTLHAFVMPTTPAKPDQGIMGRYATASQAGYALTIEDGGLALRIGSEMVTTNVSFYPSCWYSVAATYDGAGTVTLYSRSVVNAANSLLSPIVPIPGEARSTHSVSSTPGDAGTAFTIAGLARESGSTWVDSHLNGKVDRPRVWNRALSEEELDAVTAGGEPPASGLVAAWDFADGIGPSGIPTDHVTDRGPGGLHGMCVNFPARAMTGWNWRGIEEVYRHAPEEYGAIHFHEDDLEDCGWETDISWTVPDGLRSGCYALRLGQGDAEDWVPFFVLPPRGKPPQRPSSSFRPPATSPTRTSTSSTTCRWRRRSSGTRPSSRNRTSTSTATPSSASRPTTLTRTAAASTPPPRSGPSSTCGRSSAWRRARSGSSRPISISSTGSTRWASSTTSPPIASCTTRAPPCSSATTSSSPAPTPSTTRARCSTRGRRTSPRADAACTSAPTASTGSSPGTPRSPA